MGADRLIQMGTTIENGGNTFWRGTQEDRTHRFLLSRPEREHSAAQFCGNSHRRRDKYVLAGLVDTAGYASDIAEKYQGFFITEVKVKIEGSELVPGEYGLGFVGERFVITDVGANDVLTVSSKRDDNLKRATPLKIAKEGDAYRLYAGKKYVMLELE